MEWTGIAFALAAPGAGGLASRLSKYLHPLAGRPLAWHTLHALAALRPAPRRLVVAGGPELSSELFADLGVEVVVVDREGDVAAAVAGAAGEGAALAVDAAASPSAGVLQHLVDYRGLLRVEDERSRPLAAWVDRLPPGLTGPGDVRSPRVRVDEGGFVVESRAELARASVRVRDRLVHALMDAGATFLLPDTVLVDVDVRIGRDTVVYPNVVLEGQTTIGDETVVGPGCRIVDSWIGSGVELKGFNHLSHTSIRNRAILEPHVRRGFD